MAAGRLGGYRAYSGEKRIMPDGVERFINYRLTPLQAALIEWGKQHPYGRIQVIFQDGIPVKALVPTPDGCGTESILFDKIARQVGIIKADN